MKIKSHSEEPSGITGRGSKCYRHFFGVGDDGWDKNWTRPWKTARISIVEEKFYHQWLKI